MKTESYNITKVAGSDTEGIEIFAMQDGDQSNTVRTGPEQPGSISFGNLFISKMFFGNNEISKLFLGSLEIYNNESSSSYSLTVNVTNGTAHQNNPSTILNTAEIKITPQSSDYYFSSLSATNATISSIVWYYNQNCWGIEITNPTGPVSITIGFTSKSNASYYSIIADPNGHLLVSALPHDDGKIYENEILMVDLCGNEVDGYAYSVDDEGTGSITNCTVIENRYAGSWIIKNPTGNVVANWDETEEEIEPEPEEPTLISFAINGVEYQAEEDMTWVEWCDSEYNTSNWVITEDNHIFTDDNGIARTIFVDASNVIVADNNYTATHSGGSND